MELTEKELLKRVRAIIDPKMKDMGLKHNARASDILRRCIMREYEKGHWKMRNPGNPFYANAWFNVSITYNEPDEFVTPEGIAGRLETFKHRMLPTEWDIDKRYTDNIKDLYGIAAYPNCSIFTLNGVEHVRHTYGMVYFCSSNPPEDMDWQPEGKEFPQSENRKITIDRPKKAEPPAEKEGEGWDETVRDIIAHCENAKDTQPLSNIGHHERWDNVIDMIERGEILPAIQYAEKYAARGWRAWKELEKMLGEL